MENDGHLKKEDALVCSALQKIQAIIAIVFTALTCFFTFFDIFLQKHENASAKSIVCNRFKGIWAKL